MIRQDDNERIGFNKIYFRQGRSEASYNHVVTPVQDIITDVLVNIWIVMERFLT